MGIALVQFQWDPPQRHIQSEYASDKVRFVKGKLARPRNDTSSFWYLNSAVTLNNVLIII